ncbi:hypothetical protein DFH07DRAFT_966827 [Mycena maculata]|uniref:Uncharacterized protein n=1 Tax=Mycena maculata TaxID=230809 RepID=A0AAD7MXI2_9AGAR|nr:hypothetical protein DFH07DRAFT_966827 [Mycena maculata]
MAHNPDNNNNNGSDPNFITDPPLVPDPDFIPNPHYDPRYDNIHFDPRYDRAPEPHEARRGEDAWQDYADPEQRVLSGEWQTLWRLAETPAHILHRTNTAHVLLHHQHVEQQLELRAVQARLDALTRNYEILARTHERLVDYYVEATGDLSAAMRRIARLQRDLSEAREGTPEAIEAMFKSPDLYLKHVTSSLYGHVPSKYHELLDAEKFSGFGEDFIKHLNAGRSSAVNSLKSQLPQILTDFKLTNAKDSLLYHPGENKSLPPTAYPPIFYPNLKKNTQTLLLNEALPMALRCMLFGAASIRNKGAGKPQAGTLGYKWRLEGLTVGSLCFTLIVVLRIISEVDTVFEATGKISKIPFQAYFYKYKKMLLKNAQTPGVRNILKTWNKIVFAGVLTVTATATSINGDGVDDDLDEAAMEAEFAVAMEGMTLGNDEDNDYDLGDEDGGLSGNDGDGEHRTTEFC